MRTALNILGVLVALIVLVACIALFVYLLTKPAFVVTLIAVGVVYGLWQLRHS